MNPDSNRLRQAQGDNSGIKCFLELYKLKNHSLTTHNSPSLSVPHSPSPSVPHSQLPTFQGNKFVLMGTQIKRIKRIDFDCWCGLCDPYRMTRLWKCFVWDSFKVTRIDGHADLKDLKGLILIDPYRMTRLWKCFVWDSFKVTSIDGHADLKNWKDWFGLLIWIMRSLQDERLGLQKIRAICVIRGKKLTHS